MQKALRYIKRAARVAGALARDPVEALIELRSRVAEFGEKRRAPPRYEADPDWEQRMHEHLGHPWPCESTAEFWELWPRVLEPLVAKGLRIGPATFGPYNDGEPELVRAVWCLTRHLRPDAIVETGVARGFTSRFALEALERNGAGRLWSIDRPPRMESRKLEQEIGEAVGAAHYDRWSYIRGSSRLRLPPLLERLGQIDLFVHDSRHTEDNMRFEMERAWAVLRPGGALVVDDIDNNGAFRSFAHKFRAHPSLICQAEPLQPDLRRFNDKGLFGIVIKS